MRKNGEQLYITARLLSTSDGGERWSGNYEGQMKDLTRIESEIVAGAARVLGSGPSGNAGGGQRAANPEAYDLYLRGEFAFINVRIWGMSQRPSDFFRRQSRKIRDRPSK